MADRTLEEAEAEVKGLKAASEAKNKGLKKVAFSGVAKTLGEREVEVIITTDQEDRDQDIVEPKGVRLQNYNKNPVVLFQHRGDAPIARTVKLNLYGNRIEAIARFPTPGVRKEADEIYGLIKDEIINAASIGFLPITWEARDKQVPWGGQIFKECDLLEWSFVSVPSNHGALIIGRSLDHEVGKFYSWATENGLAYGQVKSMEEQGLQLKVWDFAGGVWAETEGVFAVTAEQAGKTLSPFKGFAGAQEINEETHCPAVVEAGIAKAARLRAIDALRLRTI